MTAKKAQITIFVILGLILLASAGIFMYFQDTKQQIPETVDKASVAQYVNSCIHDVAKEVITKVSMQGGMYEPILYRTYEGNNISYWCYGESPHQCINGVFTKEDVAGQIVYGIKQELDFCLDFQSFEEQGYTVAQGNFEGNAVIKDEEVEISITYPIKIENKNTEVVVEDFQAIIKTPLGQLYNVAHDIINSEAEHEQFVVVPYALNHTDISIEKNKPYPSIIYTIKKGETVLQFAVQGIETVGSEIRFGANEPAYGCCYVNRICYANTPVTVCTQKQGMYESLPCSCEYAHLAIQTLCDGRECSDCKIHEHGESWCEYDAQTGKGKDLVGSRHYLYSCINGNIIHEACRDYREEICVESGAKAVCRPNRWQDCSVCTTEQCCENREERDCYWQNNLCAPYVPPGFKFWEYNGLEYCSIANQQQACSGLSCSQESVDAAAISCYSQGDCGNYKNTEMVLTKSGFFTSNFRYEPSDDIYDVDSSADSLALPLSIEKQHPLLMAPVAQAADIFVEIIAAAYRFVNQWVDITVPNYLNPFTKKPKIEVVEVSFCLPWQAPNTGQYCSQCGSSAKCTEYLCRSLGKKCVYEENNGYPACTEVAKEKQKPFTMNLTAIPSGYSAVEKTLSVQDIEYKGYTITPALAPYSLFTIGINTSVESICYIDYTPRAEYFDMPVFLFGAPEYKQEHILAMRVPPQVVIPQKLKDSLNLSTAEQIVHAFLKPEELLENYEVKFPAVFSVYKTVTGNNLADELKPSVDRLLELINHVELSYPYYENLSITLMDKFDKGGYYLFVSCEDKYGNQQEKELFLEINIANETGDTTPPSIVKFDPDNNAMVSEIQIIPLSIYTNEPADCRYDAEDKPYVEMANAFICKNKGYDLVAVAGGSYECTTILAETPVYISCADNPGNAITYAFNVHVSNTTGVDGRLYSPYIPEDEENPLEEYAEYIAVNETETENATTMRVSSYLLSEHATTFNTSKEKVFFYLYIDDKSICTVNNATDMQNMECASSDEKNKGEYFCAVNLTVTEKQEYTISCKKQQIQQNVMESVKYSLIQAEPLDILSITPANNEEVAKETAVAVSTSSSQDMQCGYAEYGSVEYVAMEKVSDTLFTAIVSGLNNGYNTYAICCTDSYGNKAEEVVSWYVK